MPSGPELLRGFAAFPPQLAVPSGSGTAYVKPMLSFGGLAFPRGTANRCGIFRFVFRAECVAGSGALASADSRDRLGTMASGRSGRCRRREGRGLDRPPAPRLSPKSAARADARASAHAACRDRSRRNAAVDTSRPPYEDCHPIRRCPKFLSQISRESGHLLSWYASAMSFRGRAAEPGMTLCCRKGSGTTTRSSYLSRFGRGSASSPLRRRSR